MPPPTGCGTQAETVFPGVAQPEIDGAVPRSERPRLQDGVTRAGSGSCRSPTASGPAGPGSAPLSRASPPDSTGLADSRAASGLARGGTDLPGVPSLSCNSSRGAASPSPLPSLLASSHELSTIHELAYNLGTPHRDRQSPNGRRSVQERMTLPPLLLHVGPSACATPTLPSPPKSAPSSKSLSALPLPPPLNRAKHDGFYRLSVSPSRAARGGSSADADDVITTLSFPLPLIVPTPARHPGECKSRGA